MYESNNILYDRDNTQLSASPSDAIEIDYQKLEQSYYNAIVRASGEQNSKNIVENDSDIVEFSSDTDSKYYTVGVDVAPTSSAQQNTIYLLDIRNILLIFLFSWFLLTAYSKIKNLMINYHKD